MTSTVLGSTHSALAHTMASVSELTCIYSAHDHEVMVTEEKINALMKAAGVNVEPFWLGLFAKALASVHIGSLVCKVGADEPAPAGGLAPSTTAAPHTLLMNRRWKQRKKNRESEDDMGFGLSD
ncbi:60S acidic ribosomal protein P1-like [Ursus americanus]|nr:60S acidic ribosomal protein P1-like [Ursus arctos]XP_045661747.1 60S acidic ribosomal protein P1-like [Ursus americanus]